MWITHDRLSDSKRKFCALNAARGPALPAPSSTSKYLWYDVVSFAMGFHKVALDVWKSWPPVVCAVHLYYALRQKHQPICAWPDADRLISIHTEGQVFLERTPKNIKESFAQLTLACGLPLQAYARDRRGSAPRWKDPRGIGDPSRLVRLLWRGHRDVEAQAYTFCQIELLLRKQSLYGSSTKPPSKKIKSEEEELSRIPVVPFLEALETNLKQDVPKILFDYLGLWKRSLTVLETMRLKLGDSLRFGTTMTDDFYIDERFTHFVAIEIFKIACYAMYDFQHPLGDVEHPILDKAGAILQEFLEQNGDSGCRKADSLLEKLPGLG